MCKFTRLSYVCGHAVLLTTPENTLLCPTALNCNFVQGISFAPASCFPLSGDVDNRALIAVQNWSLTFCPSCELEDARTPYTASDARALLDLSTRVGHLGEAAVKARDAWEARLDLQVELRGLEGARFAWLKERMGKGEFEYLLLGDIAQCRRWMPLLRQCVAQRAPRALFDTGFQFVVDKVNLTWKKLRAFLDVAVHLGTLAQLQKGNEQQWAAQMGKLAGELQDLYDDREPGNVMANVALQGHGRRTSAAANGSQGQQHQTRPDRPVRAQVTENFSSHAKQQQRNAITHDHQESEQEAKNEANLIEQNFELMGLGALEQRSRSLQERRGRPGLAVLTETLRKAKLRKAKESARLEAAKKRPAEASPAEPNEGDARQKKKSRFFRAGKLM